MKRDFFLYLRNFLLALGGFIPYPLGMSGVPSVTELERRVLFALVGPAAAWCRKMRVPLNELEQLSKLAYYEELRHRGNATQAEVADVFGKSLRTIVEVERQYRSTFLAPEYEESLSRRVEEALTDAPQTATALALAVDADPNDVERVVGALNVIGRVDGDPESGYVRSTELRSLVRDDLLARIDGLKHQLEVLMATVNNRFAHDKKQMPSMARTLAFLGTRESIEEMGRAIARELRLRAIEVEEHALQEGGYERYGLTFALAATEHTR